MRTSYNDTAFRGQLCKICKLLILIFFKATVNVSVVLFLRLLLLLFDASLSSALTNIEQIKPSSISMHSPLQLENVDGSMHGI